MSFNTWTAVLADGRTLADDISALIANKAQVVLFTLNTSGRRVSVRLTDGMFDLGSGWTYHPRHQLQEQYEIMYRRRCSGNLVNGKIETGAVEYHVGYKPGVYAVCSDGGFSDWNSF